MSIHLLQELVHNGDKIKEDVWYYNGPNLAIDEALRITSELETQLEVQNVLLSTVKLLKRHPRNQPLPNQQATRVKHFIKFVFGPPSRAKDRQLQLRSLDCTSLKLCGLSYTVREISEMDLHEFNVLTTRLPSFARVHNLDFLLCRDDINRIVHGDFEPEDEDAFKAFLLSHISLRLSYRNGLESGSKSPVDAVSTNFDNSNAEGPPSISPQPCSDVGKTRKRPRLEPNGSENMDEGQTGRQIQYMYSNAPISQICLLGDLLSQAIQGSRQWHLERRLGDLTTTCLTTMIPEDPTQDISVTLWVGQEAGLQMNDTFNLVPKWISSPKHVGP
ncbi:hypothetical protein MAJ_08653, partial [Metarhizium majus ARSEF 297]